MRTPNLPSDHNQPLSVGSLLSLRSSSLPSAARVAPDRCSRLANKRQPSCSNWEFRRVPGFLRPIPEVSEVVPEFLLMDRIEAAPDPSPQHQPMDLGLKLSGECQSHLINPARLDNSKAVLRISKTWPQAKAKQV